MELSSISFEAFETWIENTYELGRQEVYKIENRKFFDFYFFKRLNSVQKKEICQKVMKLSKNANFH